jgi:hypothetical protein
MSHIFSVSGFALPLCCAMYILMILYLLCLLPVQFCYIIVYIRKIESHVQIADGCAPWKVSSDAEDLFCRSCHFKTQATATNS